MMSLCKKSVHSFLGFSNSKDNFSFDLSRRNSPPPAAGGLTFFSVSKDADRSVNVVESAAVKKAPPPTTTTTSTTDVVAATTEADPSETGFKKPPLATTSTTDVVSTTTGGDPSEIGFKEQPPCTTTTTTTVEVVATATKRHQGGSGFSKPALPTTTTGVVATTKNSDPGGIGFKKPPPPPPLPPPTITDVVVATTKGHTSGLCFPKPPPPTTPGVVATTTKSDPCGTEFQKLLPPTTTTKRDPGSIGFLDEVGGSVDGLMSCTESLGFESSDERRDGQILNNLPQLSLPSKPKKTIPLKKEVKKFPPPLSSLNEKGKPKFYLRPMRKDGRLELTEVKIQLPETLHASRQDGRLRLHFICNNLDEDSENQAEEEKQEPIQEDAEEIQENIEEEREEKLEGQRAEDGWKIPATGGGGDGFRRCHEVVASRHHRHRYHQPHVWSQRCVTIG